MFKYKAILLLLLVAVSGLLITSCEKDEGNEKKISHHGSSESHNMGQNCMECHKSGGGGSGWFNAAGTVYDSLGTNTLANATIKLYTQANGAGNVKYTIQADAKGNFYTTENVNFGDGLFPSVEGPTGAKFMSTSVQTGACNSCHGITTGKLWGE